jgi:hypothetical protein
MRMFDWVHYECQRIPVGFYEYFTPNYPLTRECDKSPDGKHMKGMTPLRGINDNNIHSICKYCGKELD